MYAGLFRGSRQTVLLRAGVLIAAIAIVDWRVIAEVPLGFLYLIPMAMVGGAVGRVPLVAIALLCTFLAEIFSDLVWNLRTGISRDVLYFAAFVGAGLFIREVNNNRKVTLAHLHEIECRRDARREAEEQLKVLIESSPVAIVTMDVSGRVLMANEAAHRMMGVPQGELPGRTIYRHLPALTNVSMGHESQQRLRAVMQAHGQRDDGETFLADICFSTYRINAGPRLAPMVLDASEDLRAHEESGLHQLLAGSRIEVSALSHEIRNVCGAITAVHRNLARGGLLARNKDFEALGSLARSLEKIANVNLRQSASQASEVDLAVLLDEPKIVLMPSLHEEGIATQWTIEPDMALVWADRSSLMQVFLNLVGNSTRALSKKSHPVLSVTAKAVGRQVRVKFVDNGGGVEHTEHLFRPFQAGAEATGLGFYLSRAFMRSFSGDLRYRPLPGGTRFIVELLLANASGQDLQCQKSEY